MPELHSNILILIKGNTGQRISYWSGNCFTDKILQVVFVPLRTLGAMLKQIATALNSDGQSYGAYITVPDETEDWISPFRKLWYFRTNSC